MSETAASKTSEQIYNVQHWGGGFFKLNRQGQVSVQAGGNLISLEHITEQARQDFGLRHPILLRFTHILHARIAQLSLAFNQAIREQRYDAGYTPVYPIKVNQQRRVIEELIASHSSEQPVGLEAGSKPELLAVLALAPENALIVCNGYKDDAFIELALLGEELGHTVIIVIEKLDELERVARLAKQKGIQPHLGLRVRLNHSSQGNWQNSGGLKSKFGLSNSQLIDAIHFCAKNGLTDSLVMLHFHLGSQVANLSDIKNGVIEAARYYTSMRKQGLPIRYFDVGGGLGIDYEGSRSRSYFSMNYSLNDYGWHIVDALKHICDEAKVAHPHIISESGRALTAHHAVLISDIIEIEQLDVSDQLPQFSFEHSAIDKLGQLNQQLRHQQLERLTEVVHEIERLYEDIGQLFLAGDIQLGTLAKAETLFLQNLKLAQSQLDFHSKRHRELNDRLNEQLADKVFLNFSLFQSIPDAWGISQIFPVLPLSKLDGPINRRATIQDITCDSDGRINDYVDGEAIEPTLPIPNALAKGDLMGVFLVGAYQEILGDLHNLFGDTDSIDVVIDAQGNISFDSPIKGDTTASVLRYVNFEPEQLIQALTKKIASQLDGNKQPAVIEYLETLLDDYTYLQSHTD
ncbi:MAG: biosynthetic arginine decarboxylase [Pseudomonadota bacterium]|nr:biosynthetic arginine decarboxylase [Pseudomonadota bacterium]